MRSVTGSEELKARAQSLLEDLGACPATPFWEERVAGRIRAHLHRLGLSPQEDKYGNLLVHVRGQNPEEPPIALVAHMDHPGFEAVEALDDTIVARALGGVPQACFSQRVRVHLLDTDGRRVAGELRGAYGPPEERTAALHLDSPTTMVFPRPVVLDLPDFRLDGDRVSMRAVDDLAGCACMLMALESAIREQPPGDLYALFTRAEEVGLIGARLTASEGRLPQDCLVVSLEASRTLPGAAMGEGPVIRVGDATYTFDAEAEQVLHTAREELRRVDPEFKCQRQLMSGGTCEASAFAIHGYHTTGVAFPLGNYHNAAPEGGVAAEQISMRDFVSGVQLVCQALQSVTGRNDSPAKRRLRTVPPEHRERLTRPAP